MGEDILVELPIDCSFGRFPEYFAAADRALTPRLRGSGEVVGVPRQGKA